MRFLPCLSIISRCTLSRRLPVSLGTIPSYRIESLHTTSVLGFIQRRKWNEQRIREMDNLPVHYTLIYRNPMYNYVSATTFITTASFLAMGGFLAHRLITGEFSFNPEAIETAVAGPLTSDITEVYVMAVFFVLFNLILRITLNRFPLRIYRTGDSYLAIYTWKLPFRNETLEFAQGDTIKTPPKGILWKDCRYTIKGRKNILLYDYFRAPVDLHTMMESKKKNN